MSQAPDFKDMKGKITLTWGDKPTKPAPQAAPAPQTAPAPKPQTPAPQAAPAPKPQAPTPQTAPAPKPQAPTPQTAPAPKPQAPTPHTAPAPATAEKTTGEIKTKAAPQETQAEAPAQAAETPATTTKKPGKKTSWGAILFDTLLVLMLVGIIGAGAWYMHQQLEQYRVPSPMELAQAEHLELCKQHEELQNAAYKADEQLHMRQRITNLELQLADVNRQIAELNQGIANERERIHSLQREIRHEDKTSRGVAKSLLIGLPIGNASTVNGRVYPDAHIHRLEAGRITLRTPHGQVRFPVAQLVKENLPDMVRYAFGIDDLVDMSDFEAEPGAPAPRKKRQGKLISLRKLSTQVTEPNYEPAPGAPVLNAQTPPATITVEPGLTPEDDGSWQAPHEPLPIEE